MSLQRKEKGFTIIEVVLVLAIAGLIFLMVFLALPALQRSQRDTQRKNDMSRAQTALTSYSSNNRGAIPVDLASFESQYLAVGSDSFVDPSGVPASGEGVSATTPATYVMKSRTVATPITSSFTDNQNVIYYTSGATCDSSDASNTVKGSTRSASLQMVLEGGGVYCVNN